VVSNSAPIGDFDETETLSRASFEAAFEKFDANLKDFNGSSFSGFSDGLIDRWESYKLTMREIALERLNAAAWESADIGSGRILQALIESIEIRESNNIRNNLVAWEARPNQPSLTQQLRDQVKSTNTRQQVERVLFDLFRGNSDHAAALEKIVELIGRRYPLVAYIFFILDDNLYMPIAPRTFDRAFAELGLNLRMSGKCSWENFTSFNNVIRRVQLAFVDWKGIADTRLIDAHSWIWVMARLPEKIEQQKKQGVRKPDDLKRKMIEIGSNLVLRAAHDNGQSEERVVKNKELFGFPSQENLYEFLGELWERQQGLCKLTNLPMMLNVPRDEPNEMIVSVDRIDSDGHYSPNNLQLTCWFANRWKGVTPNDRFLDLLDIVRDVAKAPSEEFVTDNDREI